jgi:aspartate/methionine/tyrosine aminotransferase
VIITPARRMQGIQRTLIRRIFDAAPADALNLGLGQPDLPTPDAISLAGIAGIAEHRTGYSSTAGDPALRAALAERYHHAATGPESILVTVGSQEAMFASCLSLVDPGDEILYPDPGYPAYPVVAEMAGAHGVPYPLKATNQFRIDPADIESRITERTRLVIICEPSNPTGAISSQETLRSLAALLEARGIPWISDEIYSGFSYQHPFVSISEIAPAGGLVIGGLSKDLSMTGWRIGWVIGPPEIIQRITATHQYLVTCAPSVSQTAARAAFTSAGRAEAERYLAIFRGRRDVMAEELSRIPGIDATVPDGAFYFFINVSAYGDSLEIARRILEKQRVVTIPGEAFGVQGAGYLRISFATTEANIRRGIRAIGDELSMERGD